MELTSSSALKQSSSQEKFWKAEYPLKAPESSLTLTLLFFGREPRTSFYQRSLHDNQAATRHLLPTQLHPAHPACSEGCSQKSLNSCDWLNCTIMPKRGLRAKKLLLFAVALTFAVISATAVFAPLTECQ